MRLVCHQGALQGLTFEIPLGRTAAGRESFCPIVLDDPKVSRLHLFLVLQDKSITCIDNNSTNGTFINGERLTPETPFRLSPEDVLTVGNSDFRIEETPVAAPTLPGPVQFTEAPPQVTRIIPPDLVAQELAKVFDLYRQTPKPEQKVSDTDSARARKMMRSLETLYKMSRRVSQLMPLEHLYGEMRNLLFEAFENVENLVFLVYDEEAGECIPKLVANIHGADSVPIVIPHSAFRQAMDERVTIVANNAAEDTRFAHSESIVGLAIHSFICAPLSLGDRVLGALYVDNRSHADLFGEEDAELLTAFASQAAVAIDNARLCDVLQRSYHETLQALVNTIEAKDPYTRGHSRRVANYAVEIGKELGLSTEALRNLQMAAELHDIGKIGLRELIINKSGRLTETEYLEVKDHTLKGEAILRPIGYLNATLPIIRSHHERWDGQGYPEGLRGEEIDLGARILSVADAVDAMTTQRAYNQPVDMRTACEEIRRSAGTQFDPAVVEAFLRCADRLTNVLLKES